MSRRISLSIFFGLAILLSGSTAHADDWPEYLGPNRSSEWKEDGIVSELPAGTLKRKWSVPVAGGYAGPSVANGRVYLADYMTKGDRSPNPTLRNKLVGKERVLCLSAETGDEIWKHEYDCAYEVSYPAGPRCTPTVDGDLVFTLGSMGHLFCLKTADGSVVWSKDFRQEYNAPTPHWGFCGHPLVDGDRLYCVVGGAGSVAVCFDKRTGKEIWRALSASQQGYCPPALIEAGGTRQLLIWHADSLNSLDPKTGKSFWSIPMKPNYGMSIAVPRKSGDYLFAGAYTNVSMAARLSPDGPAAERLWEGNGGVGIGPVNMTPYLQGRYAYGVDHRGHVRCVDLETGKRLWSDLEPITHGKALGSATGFIVRHQDRFFIASEDGDLIIAEMNPEGYKEVSRAKLLDVTTDAFGRKVVWSHPAFANKCVFARNDKELICVSLAAGK